MFEKQSSQSFSLTATVESAERWFAVGTAAWVTIPFVPLPGARRIVSFLQDDARPTAAIGVSFKMYMEVKWVDNCGSNLTRAGPTLQCEFLVYDL